MGGNLTFHSLLIIWLVLLMSLVILNISASHSCCLPWRSCCGTTSPRKLPAASPPGNRLQIRTFSALWNTEKLLFSGNFHASLFSHGYSKPLCSLNFPASSPRTHRSCVSSLFTLWPHCHLITVPGLLLDYRVSRVPLMQLLRAEI